MALFEHRAQTYNFSTWTEREHHAGLKDAWLASIDFPGTTETSELQAHCDLCAESTPFKLLSADCREGLLCARCNCNARIRAAIGILLHTFPQARLRRNETLGTRLRNVLTGAGRHRLRIYATEQATPTYVWLQTHLDAHVTGSEFEPDAEKRAVLTKNLAAQGGRGEVVFQDVTALTCKDARLDAILSFDVLEHVPDYRAALREFARVLKPGGTCIATFPFTDQPDTVTRARIDSSGNLEHLLPPEFHGDPISGGVLCFYHFGWDILDACRQAGFTKAVMSMPYALGHGLPYGMWTLVATR